MTRPARTCSRQILQQSINFSKTTRLFTVKNSATFDAKVAELRVENQPFTI